MWIWNENHLLLSHLCSEPNIYLGLDTLHIYNFKIEPHRQLGGCRLNSLLKRELCKQFSINCISFWRLAATEERQLLQRSGGSELGRVPVLLHIIGIIKWTPSASGVIAPLSSVLVPTCPLRTLGWARVRSDRRFGFMCRIFWTLNLMASFNWT